MPASPAGFDAAIGPGRADGRTSSGRQTPALRWAVAARILIVEDDPDIAQLIALYLEKAGLGSERLASGRDAIASIAARPPDLVILDLMLPHVDGFDVCRAVRANPATAGVPVLMLTARGEEADRVAGLEIGADDYLTKPFSPSELVARERALLRRAARTTGSAPSLAYGPVTMDVDSHVVAVGGAEVALAAKEFLLLEYFLRNRGRVVSRDRLLTDVWGYRYTGGTRTVDVHVRRLREKIPFFADALITVPQFGYKLVDPPPAATR
jgi:DNA-binding response OmpR family regulator